MIFEVKLQYSFLVEANDQSSAYAKAIQTIRDNPHVVISGIRQSTTYRKRRSLLSSIVWGSK
jgi:hypothetical protein